jgi:GDPmannose 4,6-dehydratase
MIRRSPLKRALITGITGQDGFHLTELLQSKDYKIFGLLNGQRNSRVLEFSNKFPDVEMLEGDLTDFSSLMRAIDISKPNELYNLGAISFVWLSFKQPELTANVTGLGPLRLLEAIRTLGVEKEIKLYQASSSEMFGKVLQVPQNEATPFYPDHLMV